MPAELHCNCNLKVAGSNPAMRKPVAQLEEHETRCFARPSSPTLMNLCWVSSMVERWVVSPLIAVRFRGPVPVHAA